MSNDERIDFERAVVDAGVKEATERLCDMLNEIVTMITDMRDGLKKDYKYTEKFCHGDLIDLGKSSAHSIVHCLVDDMPIDFRRVLSAVLEGDETVENEDDILDRIREGTLERIKEVIE